MILSRESRKRKVYVCALLIVTLFFRSGRGSGIECQAGVADIRLLTDVQVPHRRLDVNTRVAVFAFVAGSDAASGQHAEDGQQPTHRQLTAESYNAEPSHAEHRNLLNLVGLGLRAPGVPDRRPGSRYPES